MPEPPTTPRTDRVMKASRLPSPLWAGESHVGLGKLLQAKEKWILKVFPDSEGDADETLCGVFFQLARSSGGQCAARSDGDFVHRSVGDAVRGKGVLRHCPVRPDERSAAANAAGVGTWGAE